MVNNKKKQGETKMSRDEAFEEVCNAARCYASGFAQVQIKKQRNSFTLEYTLADGSEHSNTYRFETTPLPAEGSMVITTCGFIGMSSGKTNDEGDLMVHLMGEKATPVLKWVKYTPRMSKKKKEKLIKEMKRN